MKNLRVGLGEGLWEGLWKGLGEELGEGLGSYCQAHQLLASERRLTLVLHVSSDLADLCAEVTTETEGGARAQVKESH